MFYVFPSGFGPPSCCSFLMSAIFVCCGCVKAKRVLFFKAFTHIQTRHHTTGIQKQRATTRRRRETKPNKRGRARAPKKERRAAPTHGQAMQQTQKNRDTDVFFFQQRRPAAAAAASRASFVLFFCVCVCPVDHAPPSSRRTSRNGHGAISCRRRRPCRASFRPFARPLPAFSSRPVAAFRA